MFAKTTKFSNIFVVAGFGAWFLTFLLGFVILAPSTDDGYYSISAMGTVINGSPGFWIGDEFSPSFFLPTAFTYFYGLLLKLTMILGLDFGAFGFRVYQFLFIFLVPVISALLLRRIFPRDYGIRFFILITGLLVTYFAHSAPTVRPEILGILLFTLFLTLRGSKFGGGALPAFVLALSGTMHPNFMILAITVFTYDLIRNHRLIWSDTLKRTFGSLVAFAVPFGVLAIYYLNNWTEYQQQVTGRSRILSPDFWKAPTMIWDHLHLWNHADGISNGSYVAYPAFTFLVIMLVSTFLVWQKRVQVWQQEKYWLCLPMLIVQWGLFMILPNYLPYLALSSFLAMLIIVLLWQQPQLWVPSKRTRYAFIGVGLALCMVYLGFHTGKSVLFPEQRLTSSSVHSAMSVLLDDPDAKLYTNTNRLIAPLLDDFQKDGKIRLNLTYLDPDCLPPHLMERADEHALKILPASDPQNTYWGFNKNTIIRFDDGDLAYITKGATYRITVTPSETVYEDNKNLIVRASSVRTEYVDFDDCE